MFKSALIRKSITAAAVVITAVIVALPAYSQESSVNSTDTSLILYGGLGYGQSSYGSSNGDSLDLVTNLGEGPSKGITCGTLISWSIIGAELSYTSATFEDMESDVSETYGDGNFWTIDGKLGLKLFTEPADMGYTFFYGGMKYWEATRKVDYQKVDGIRVADSGYKDELSGKGWSIGFRDYSTYPVGSFSFVLQTGLMIFNAPLDSGQNNGDKVSFKVKDSMGQAVELGLGVAFENIGLSVMAGIKSEYNATSYKVDGASEYEVLGIGFDTFFLTLTKDFSI